MLVICCDSCVGCIGIGLNKHEEVGTGGRWLCGFEAAGQWQPALAVFAMMARPTGLCIALATETCEKGTLEAPMGR